MADHIDLTKTPHEVRPSGNGGVLVVFNYGEKYFKHQQDDMLTFSDPLDYMAYITKGHQNTQKEKVKNGELVEVTYRR